MRERDTKEQWEKPRSAIVRNLIEVGLDSQGSIYTYISQLKPELNIDELLFGVDVFHIIRLQDKPKSKPQILSIQRYPPNRKAIAEFTQLQHKLFNPLFRLQYWQNLIRDRPRIEGFYTLLRDLPAAETVKNNSFCRDFRTVFNPSNNPMEQEGIDNTRYKNTIEPSKTSQQTETKETSLESLLLRLLKTYTRHQLERQFKLKWDENWEKQKKEELKQNKAYQNYKEKRKQIVLTHSHA